MHRYMKLVTRVAVCFRRTDLFASDGRRRVGLVPLRTAARVARHRVLADGEVAAGLAVDDALVDICPIRE